MMRKTAIALFASFLVDASQASHLDAFDFKWDSVKFKTKTDCQLDTYPNVSWSSLCAISVFNRSKHSSKAIQHSIRTPRFLSRLMDSHVSNFSMARRLWTRSPCIGTLLKASTTCLRLISSRSAIRNDLGKRCRERRDLPTQLTTTWAQVQIKKRKSRLHPKQLIQRVSKSPPWI